MGLTDVDYSIETLLNELPNIHRWDRPYCFVALMLRDSFDLVAPRVPESLRAEVQACISELASAERLGNWELGSPPDPNIHQEQLRAWSEKLTKNGWPTS